MPKINEMMLRLKGFKCDVALDLNTVYYYIKISENKITLCVIFIS